MLPFKSNTPNYINSFRRYKKSPDSNELISRFLADSSRYFELNSNNYPGESSARTKFNPYCNKKKS
jgi:hypothetical protein